jgi:hypothetical protein
MSRTAARGNYPRTAAEGPRLRWRTDGLRTSPVGRAGVFGASEMATGVVVGSAVILAPGRRRSRLRLTGCLEREACARPSPIKLLAPPVRFLG